jgi:hypothetical protein
LSPNKITPIGGRNTKPTSLVLDVEAERLLQEAVTLARARNKGEMSRAGALRAALKIGLEELIRRWRT